MSFFGFVLRLRRYQRATFAAIYAGFFIVLLALLAATGFGILRNNLDNRLAAEARNFDRFEADLGKTIEALGSGASGEPCSEPFLQWLRRVAFLPDGIHEIIYAPGGQMRCSVSLGIIDGPIALEAPDFLAAPDGAGKIWLDRDLSMLGFPGMLGTFLQFGDFILILPDVSLEAPMPDWIDYEVVYSSIEGTVWHRLGVHDLYSAISGATNAHPWNMSHASGLSVYGCDHLGDVCLVMSAPIAPLLKDTLPLILGAVFLVGLLAGIFTRLLRGSLERVWSLPSRFRRRLSVQTVVCHYQPLLDLHEDRIYGVEVLARWRDDDGTLIYPDQFLPIVERKGLHRAFTQFVVDRAYEELSSFPVGLKPMRVHFNIFPSEFEPERMLALFEDFLADRSRFIVVIELVESDALPIDRTRNAVAQLREAGILTFIDDFGEGYSSIGYLAGLDTQGVKLDRSFALAPEGSLMDAMLTSAIDMVSKTGQTLVVEGVETAGRLASLKANKKVAIAQGYFISRPIDAASLRALLGGSRLWQAANAA